jgi:pimeloyl-ACP methyl ester carboxylesterase
MSDRLVTVDGVELCLETFGDRADPAVLLIAGAAASMDAWDVQFCERLAGQGLLVVRYDHRDTGRSVSSPAGRPSYSAAELSTDPLRVLDALEITRAHLVGVSMGGGIAQELAARHPDRVRTLTLIATSPAGEHDSGPLPPMQPELAVHFKDPVPDPDWDDRAAVVDYLVEGERPYAGTLGFDAARARKVATTVVERTLNIEAAVKNHWSLTDDDAVSFRLADIAAPTLVLHGADDPAFPVAHGEALAAGIPDAALVRLEGMGHEAPPPELWDAVVPAIAQHVSAHAAG